MILNHFNKYNKIIRKNMLKKVSFQSITIPTTPPIDANIDEQVEVIRSEDPLRHYQETIDANIDEQVEVIRYAEWLAAEAKRNRSRSLQEERKKYAEDALKVVRVNDQEFRPFAPFRPALSAYKTLTHGQVVT